MKILLICGGPSLERGISLNSARSVMDHLESEDIEILPLYFDYKKRPYKISKSQLYSNTPSDFDFKLQSSAKLLSRTALKDYLKSADLAFPVMHGAFGEDGSIQKILEKYNVSYVGSNSKACRRCFDKFEANEFIKNHGFFTLPSTDLKIFHKDHKKILKAFFAEHKIARAIVKPATGGSSIGVYSVSSVDEALEKSDILFSKRIDTRVVVEPFCEGMEFTVIVLQNKFGMPVAVLPTEIETSYDNHQIFDFRKKYLPTRQVKYHCPPRFSNEIIEKIQVQAEQLFTVLGMRDFARFDGWLLKDGNIWFSDFNPISGMEQNSFLFQQGARVGFSHRELLRFIVKNSCRRFGISFVENEKNVANRKPVNVIFGGSTSERQVSLMSGTNAWLKLRRSKKYFPQPFLLDLENNVWPLPYALTLNHTVEEIMENCKNAEKDEESLHFLVEKVRMRLIDSGDEKFFVPKKMSLEDFIKSSKFVFIGLHGGIGEDGTIQKMLSEAGVIFNGSGESASSICMDKYLTGRKLGGLEREGIFVAKKVSVDLNKLECKQPDELSTVNKKLKEFWEELVKELGSKTVIVKPQNDGCSSGIVRLFNAADLLKYLEIVRSGVQSIPKGTFKNQNGIIEMPLHKMDKLLFEKFIETDSIRVVGNKLKWKKRSGFIEVTVGVLEEKGRYHSLCSSLTVAEGEVLSVEEKFQGGTGVNISPPPEKIVKKPVLEKMKKSVEKVSKILGIEGYARLDTFLNVKTGNLIIIEVNTAPALTPSTVLYHQALAENSPIYPTEFLEKLIGSKGY